MNEYRQTTDNDDLLYLLSNQVIGGQSVLFKIFKEVFKEDEKDIYKIELTYFSLSTLGYFYLRLIESENVGEIFDQLALNELNESLPYCTENKTLDSAIDEFQKRYEIYNKHINNILKKESIDPESCIVLLMDFYEKVTKKSPRDKMIQISVASSLIAQYLLDHIDFIEKKIKG